MSQLPISLFRLLMTTAVALLLSACAANPTRPYCTGPLVPINEPAK